MTSQRAISTPLIALTAAPPPKGRVLLYISSQSTSTSKGSRPASIGLKQNSTKEAATSGGCSPWHNDSPQPVTSSSVKTSTIIVLRLSTQPCEKEKGSSSGVDTTWGTMSTIFMYSLPPRQYLSRASRVRPPAPPGL